MGNIDYDSLEFSQLAEKWTRTEPDFIYASELPAQISSEFYRLGCKHGKAEVLLELEDIISKLRDITLSNINNFSKTSALISKEIDFKIRELNDLLCK